MRTRLARLLLAAARRLDRQLVDTRPRWIREGTEDPNPWGPEIRKAIMGMEYARQRYGLRAVGGQIIGPTRLDEDTVGPFKLSEGGPVSDFREAGTPPREEIEPDLDPYHIWAGQIYRR